MGGGWQAECRRPLNSVLGALQSKLPGVTRSDVGVVGFASYSFALNSRAVRVGDVYAGCRAVLNVLENGLFCQSNPIHGEQQ